jgi:hypothetical protein
LKIRLLLFPHTFVCACVYLEGRSAGFERALEIAAMRSRSKIKP